MKIYEAYDVGLTIFAGVWSINNIQDILGIIVLILTIINITFKSACKIGRFIKDKDYQGVSDTLEETIEEFKKLEEKDDR